MPRPRFLGWFVPVLFIFLCGIAHRLPAQSPPPAAKPRAATNATAAPAPPPAEPSAPADAPAAAKPPPNSAELQRAAMALQRAAIRKQAENLGLWLMPLDARPPGRAAEPPDCDPLEGSLVDPLITDAAKQHSLDPKLLRAVIAQESAFRACAVSAKGAQGLMQLMPGTAADLGVANPFDPKQSVDGGARYLKQLIDKYKGDLPQALGAYNAGPKATDDSGGVPDLQETREYVDAILTNAGLKPADPPAKNADPPAKTADTPAKPADTPAKPLVPSAKPAPSTQPAAAPAKPTGAPAQTVAAPAKPAAAPAKPADTPAQPVAAPVQPADASAKPAATPAKPNGNL
jgi:soluble lytic murein transglycosylase-like protein